MDVVVPDLGDFADVEVIEILVQAGDRVAVETPLITLETEKATMDVPSSAAGRVAEIKVSVGDQVSMGDVIVVLDEVTEAAPDGADQPSVAADGSGEDAPRVPEAASVAAAAPSDSGPDQRESQPSASELAAQTPRATLPIDEAGFSQAHASPAVRKLARELGVDLGRVRGSGHKGRVTADNVKAFVKEAMRAGGASALPAVPLVDFAKFGPIEVEPLGRIQKISGPRLHASWINIPHVTQHDEADITELEAKRQSLKGQAQARGIRLTPLAFVIRAVTLALAEFPHFKSSLTSDGTGLVLKHYVHVGFAADTPNGLVVPVIRDADRKDVYELAEALAALSDKARDGKLQADDIQGGVFTISSLGGIGGTFFTPIINAPEVAILGVSRNRWTPIWQGTEFAARLMLPMSLSYDHRVIDGANAVRFTTRLGEILGDVDRLMEAVG